MSDKKTFKSGDLSVTIGQRWRCIDSCGGSVYGEIVVEVIGQSNKQSYSNGYYSSAKCLYVSGNFTQLWPVGKITESTIGFLPDWELLEGQDAPSEDK